jgi:glycosyltransferase involved in cell wall biosynthesis
MLIGFEASALQGCKSGVGYYAENLLRSMLSVAPEHDYVLLSNRDMRSTWTPISRETVHSKSYFPVRAAWMQAVLPGVLRSLQPDICHFPNYLAPLACARPYVVTIHDMTLFITPRYHRLKKLVLDRTLLPRVARRASAIITVSKSARADIVRHLKVPKDRVRVVMNAVGPAFEPVTDAARLAAVRSRYGLYTPYILYVGTIEPRKNLVRLIRAFARLRKGDFRHKLVLVGQPGWRCEPIYAEVEKLGLKGEVIFTGYVPFEDLPVLYSGAESMAFPSLYEGFGLPILEAMACGTPVVTSSTSSLAEVADGAALLVDPHSVEELAGSIHRIHSYPALAAELREKGRQRAAQFTWENAARDTLHIYEDVLAARKHLPSTIVPGVARH